MITIRIIGLTKDRRSKAQLIAAAALDQARKDSEIEAMWRYRVRANERCRKAKKIG